MTTNEKRENVSEKSKYASTNRRKERGKSEKEGRKERAKERRKENSRWGYDDACWIRSSWDLITSILKRAHTHTFVCSTTVYVYVCVFTIDKPKTIDQCMRKASGQKKWKDRVNNTSVNRSLVSRRQENHFRVQTRSYTRHFSCSNLVFDKDLNMPE